MADKLQLCEVTIYQYNDIRDEIVVSEKALFRDKTNAIAFIEKARQSKHYERHELAYPIVRDVYQ